MGYRGIVLGQSRDCQCYSGVRGYSDRGVGIPVLLWYHQGPTVASLVTLPHHVNGSTVHGIIGHV